MSRKGRPVGREGNREALTFSTQSDEARTTTVNVLSRARNLRWNWVGHILRMDERQTTRQVLLNCVKPTLESIFGGLFDPDVVCAAINLAKDRMEWGKE